MAYKEDFLFWKLAHSLIGRGYKVFHFSGNYEELWLENFTDIQHPIIRLKRQDIDWSNWLKEDIKKTLVNAEKIRKTALRRKLQVLNIYVTSLPPVDSYEELMSKNFQLEKSKTVVRSILFAGSQIAESVQSVSHKLGFNPFGSSIKSEYDQYEVEYLKNLALQEAAKGENKEKQLLNYTKPFFTYLFLAVQIIVFFIMEISGGSANPFVLLYFGAKFNPLILEGEWWRFLTPIFLHIGFFHLLMNSFALYYLGTTVEKMYGKMRFLLIYLFSGFTGSLASFIFSPSISAGASGAIFGLFGALLYFGVVYKQTFFRTMGMNIIVIIAFNLIFGFVMPGIDNAGHIGGLIGGFLAAGFLHMPKSTNFPKQAIFFLMAILLAGFGLYYGFQFPNLN